MTAQARSRDLDTDNLVLLVDHLGKFGMAVIFNGKTEAAKVAALREAGMLSEDLITHPMHDDEEVN